MLWEHARAPDAARYEVDRLLRGLSQPLGPGEDARARADLLHLILDDPRLRAFRGSDGRQVLGATVRALVALGHPYALELSPEELEAMHAAEREDRSFVVYEAPPPRPADDLPPVVISSQQNFGWWFAMAMALLEAAIVVVSNSRNPVLLLIGLLFVTVLGVLPPLVAVSEKGMHSRPLHYLSLVVVAVPAVPWGLAAFVAILMNGYKKSPWTWWFLLPLAGTLARLVIPFLLHGRRPR